MELSRGAATAAKISNRSYAKELSRGAAKVAEITNALCVFAALRAVDSAAVHADDSTAWRRGARCAPAAA